MNSMFYRTAVLLYVVLAGTFSAYAVTLEQIISRENPAFDCRTAQFSVGRDGNVYFSNNSGYVLRMTRDGQERMGAILAGAANGVAANADGIIGVAHGHFQHSVRTYRPDFSFIGAVADFLNDDIVGWQAPTDVQVGASGDFYGADYSRHRIVRVSPSGKMLAVYPIPPTVATTRINRFRVDEQRQTFYILCWAPAEFRAVGFDGKTKWTAPLTTTFNGGGIDLDDEGNFYAIGGVEDLLKKFSPDGEQLATIKIQFTDALRASYQYGIADMRISAGEIFLKRYHPAELFQCYDLATGALKRVVSIDHDRLTVTFPTEVWTAGSTVPFRIDFIAGHTKSPRWRVWARPFTAVAYREIPFTDGQLYIPDDLAGVFQLKVTPEVEPWQRGAASEYLVRTVVEVRMPASKGTANVLTTDNRVAYGQGDAIPVQVILKATDDDLPATVTLRLSDGARVLAEGKSAIRPDARQPKFTLPSALTGALRPGRYTLSVQADGLTCVDQPLLIGLGVRNTPFHLLQYGDYGPIYPNVSAWEAPEMAMGYAAEKQQLGMNMIVDRLGEPGQLSALSLNVGADQTLQEQLKRLSDDPLAVAPEKMMMASSLLQAMGYFSAYGIEQMAILMMNDAGLPLGTQYQERRQPEQLTTDLTKVTNALLPFSAFRGWSWASNWWVIEAGAGAAATPEQKTAYQAALAQAKATGAWDPVLDTVSDRWLSYAVDATDLFNRTLKTLAPQLVTAVGSCYRNVNSYPPVSLQNVQETDLHAQWEQIAVPYTMAHNVDYYKRPGKRAFGHPEIWNDAGTGDQILTTLFQMVMRGADGIGNSGKIPTWGFQPEDPRSSNNGLPSVYRALNTALAPYGAWLTTLQTHDQVAIVISGRMSRIDEWRGQTGIYFARVLEAYTSCLHAHYPASLVFAEDITPETLKAYKAVLVVGQTVEMEPSLANALQSAKTAGVAIFADGTCRETLVAGFTPLDVAFNHFENDKHAVGDDSAYWRFRDYCRANLPALRTALGTALPPLAEVQNHEVYLTERTADNGRYLFVVNDTTLDLDPGYLWRMTLGNASRVPLVAPVTLTEPAGQAIYDVFALTQVTPKNGVLQADLRSIPARVFAMLPAAISRVALRGPRGVNAGQTFAWSVEVQDSRNSAINASIPVQIRLLARDGSVLDSQYVAASRDGAAGAFTLPLNTPPGAATLEATELFSRKTVQMQIPVTQTTIPLVLSDQPSPRAAILPANASANGNRTDNNLASADNLFGLHVRDLIVASNGTLAVMNTNNWDDNLYALDTANGKLAWQRRVGHYFAFSPQAVPNGVAVQGFDFTSAEGYHLYLLGTGGKPARRMALYGLPRRLPHRFVPGMLKDNINNFAVPADGSWVASAGDLGLAVWSRDGKLLWTQDWWKTSRHTGTLAALDNNTLLVAEGMMLSAYQANTGTQRWQLSLALTGDVRKIIASRDGSTCAVMSTTEGGRIFLIREGKIVKMLYTAAEDVDLTADGALLAVATSNQLKAYSVQDGLLWSYAADMALRSPRFSPDGQRIAAGSALGSLYVLDIAGTVRLARDMGALPVPAWLPDGSLLVGTWMGSVCRLNTQYVEQWRTRLQPVEMDIRDKLLRVETMPTLRVSDWGNAAATPAPLTPNLLAETKAMLRFVPSGTWGGAAAFILDPTFLYDGKAASPGTWLDWGNVGFFAETSPINYIRLDSMTKRLRVTGVTLVEDATHPESWLRDASFDYWDELKEVWVPVQPLLSNAAVHTHHFAQPVEASRFRIMLPWGVVGNLRLGEIVFHGEIAGNAHPDAFANKPVAVLFDEEDHLRDSMAWPRSPFAFEGAFSGGRFISLPANSRAYPQPPASTIRNWDFEIVENPQAGQYRYAQFAWKALAPETAAISITFGGPDGGVATYAGELMKNYNSYVQPTKIGESPPAAWQVQRVDLWALFKKPTRIQYMYLDTLGGPAAFDAILLGRTPEELPPLP